MNAVVEGINVQNTIPQIMSSHHLIYDDSCTYVQHRVLSCYSKGKEICECYSRTETELKVTKLGPKTPESKMESVGEWKQSREMESVGEWNQSQKMESVGEWNQNREVESR